MRRGNRHLHGLGIQRRCDRHVVDGVKTFTVTALDQAGNTTTKSVSYSVTGSTSSGSGGTRLFAWNDLGMHCMETDYSVFTLLPPFNDLNAQLMVNGKLVSSGLHAGVPIGV